MAWLAVIGLLLAGMWSVLSPGPQRTRRRGQRRARRQSLRAADAVWANVYSPRTRSSLLSWATSRMRIVDEGRARRAGIAWATITSAEDAETGRSKTRCS